MFEYRLELIGNYRVTLTPEVLGLTPAGLRVNFHLQGGEITGEKLCGKVRAGGADFMTVRADGVGVMDVQGTLETADGALIGIHYSGIVDLGVEGQQNFLQNTVPPILKLHATPQFITAHPDYLWLNRLQCVAIGEANMQTLEASYDLYALR